MKIQDVIVDAEAVRYIHEDALAETLGDLGRSRSARASHVEPVTVDGRVRWQADLQPVGGPALGPFETRATALAAEEAWLRVAELPLPLELREGEGR